MGVENLAVLLLVSVACLPFIVVIGVLVLIMTCSWSKKLRRGYIDFLLRLFRVGIMQYYELTAFFIKLSLHLQYFTVRMETAELNKKMEETKECNGHANGSVPDGKSDVNKPGYAIIKSSTVSGEDLVLMPNGVEVEPPASIPRNRSFDSLKRDFALSDCLDFVHAGMEAIIEDEVTQRFVAEELKVLSIFKASPHELFLISSALLFFSRGIC